MGLKALRNRVAAEVFAGKPSKYRNVKQQLDPAAFPEAGERSFDSKKEAAEAMRLIVEQRIGNIRNLRFQVPYRIDINGKHICRYIADFVYETKSGDEWTTVVLDAKGVETDVYRLKAKLMKAVHGVSITTT